MTLPVDRFSPVFLFLAPESVVVVKLGLIVIGIGRGVNKDELLRIAGKSNNLFLAEDFDDLRSAPFVAKVLDNACKLGKVYVIYTREPFGKV